MRHGHACYYVPYSLHRAYSSVFFFFFLSFFFSRGRVSFQASSRIRVLCCCHNRLCIIQMGEEVLHVRSAVRKWQHERYCLILKKSSLEYAYAYTGITMHAVMYGCMRTWSLKQVILNHACCHMVYQCMSTDPSCH